MECNRFLLSWNFKSSPGAAEKATGRATLGGPSGPTWGCQRNSCRRWSTRRAEFRFGSADCFYTPGSWFPELWSKTKWSWIQSWFFFLNCKILDLNWGWTTSASCSLKILQTKKSLTVGSLDASQELRARLAALRGQLSQGEVGSRWAGEPTKSCWSDKFVEFFCLKNLRFSEIFVMAESKTLRLERLVFYFVIVFAGGGEQS